jgi:hypothetical protein
MSIRLLEKIDQYSKTDKIEVIPDLAKIDRQLVGWFRIVLFGLLGSAVALVWLFLELMVVGFFVSLIMPAALDFALATFHTWWYSPHAPYTDHYWLYFIEGAPPSLLNSINPRGEWWIWAILLGATCYILYRSEGVRAIFRSITIWPENKLPPKPIVIIMQAVRGLTWAGIIIFIGGFVTMALLTLVRFVVIVTSFIRMAQDSWGSISIYLEQTWQYPALGIIGLALVFYAFRHSMKGRVIYVLTVIFGLCGLADMVWQAFMIGASPWINVLASTLVVFYPIGLAVPFSKILIPPFNLFSSTVLWIYQNITLRIRTGKCLRYHSARNNNQTKRRIWATVCTNHLVRFDSQTERLSYGRWLTYGRCPVCYDDHSVYTGVDCIALSVDENMQQKIEQKGSVLWINGLEWLKGPDGAEAPVFDTIVLGRAEKHIIEGLVVRYTSQQLSNNHRLLKKVPVHLRENASKDENTIRILTENCGPVSSGFNASSEKNLMERNLERSDTIKRQTRRIGSFLQNVGCAILIMAVALIVLASFYFYNSEAQGNIIYLFSSLINIINEIAGLF